jgi:uncharacterized repeat protein (TIGR01451 family)
VIAPAPDLHINVWGQGTPSYGNNYILEMHYNNDGWATADDVVITQTLQGMDYLSDSSGVIPDVNGNTIVWHLGSLPYWHWGEHIFYVFVHITDDTEISTWAHIDTSTPSYQDQNRKYNWWSSGVSSDTATYLTINKWPLTGDPAPGKTFVYGVNICNNNNATPSTEVIVTDTLPISITVVDWFSQQPGWEEVSRSPHELVVSIPTISGNRCSEVDLLAQMDANAEPGQSFENLAEVWASSGIDPGTNPARTSVNVNWPYANLYMNPGWVWGQFVPGGEINFEFGFGNNGNTPVDETHLTTTLPAGTEFLYAHLNDWSGWVPFEPTTIVPSTADEDGYLVWDLGTFQNGYSRYGGVTLKVLNNAQPGPITVTNTIKGEAVERRYDDNVVTYNEMVNAPGPNLSIDKHMSWWWERQGRLYFELHAFNKGDQPLDNVVITDTYPASVTQYQPECGWGHGPFWYCEIIPENHQVIYHLNTFYPGQSANLQLWLNLNDADARTQGLAFVNQADISNFGDMYPWDNQDVVTAYSGPDVFVHKWFKEGDISPGGLITYTVEFGNLNRWPWENWPYGSHITDTLPVSTTFVRSIGYWDLMHEWIPESSNDQQVVWSWGAVSPGELELFDVVVQIDEDIPIGQPLLNRVEAYGDSPNEVDSDPTNNAYQFPLEDYPGAFGKSAPADGAIGVAINPTLSWESSSKAIRYEYCYDATDNDACDGTWISTGSNTSVNLSGLTKDTTYYWQVRSLKVGGSTYANDSIWWSFTTIVEVPAEFGKIAPANGVMDVEPNPTLSWESSLRAASYEYCYDLTDDDTCDGSWTSTNMDTSVDLSGLSADTTYYWQVRARNAGGDTEADLGIWWSFTTIVAAPSGFAKLAPADGAIDVATNPTLSWGSSLRATSYEYCYDLTDDGTCEGSWISTDTDTSVDLSGLSAGITYYWQVRAVNAGGDTEADLRVWWSFTTIVQTPGAFSKTAPADGAIDLATNPTLSWGSSLRATSYEYCFSTIMDTCDGSWTSTGSNTSIALSGLSADTIYYWQVRALNAGGTVYADTDTWWSFSTKAISFSTLLPLVQKAP